MKHLKHFLPIFLIVLMSETLSGQDKRAFEVDVTSKKLNIDQLKLPGSTPLLDVLVFMPEFLQNSDQGLSARGQFDILVEGISTDVASESVLSHMHLSDLKSVSVSESPAASQQKNGSGGVINITLKELPEGFSGRASFDASTDANFLPSAMLNYRKGKFTLRSWLMFDAYSPKSCNEYRTLNTSHGTVYCIDTTRYNKVYQMARVYIDWNPTSKDKFKLRFWESTSRDENLKYMQMLPTGESDAGGRTASNAEQLSLATSYNHSFTNGQSLGAQLNYTYSPTFSRNEKRNTLHTDAEPSRKVETLYKGHNIEAAVSYGVPVFKNDRAFLKMNTGWNFTGKLSNNEFGETLRLAGFQMVPIGVEGDVITRMMEKSLYVSPYLEFNGGWKKFSYNISGRFQHSKSHIEVYDMGVDGGKNDYTGSVSLAWQAAEHHNFRLILDHGLIRPALWQMCPIMVFRPDKDSYIMGDPALKSSNLNSVSLNYGSDFRKGNSNYVLNASLGYIHAHGLITPVYYVLSGPVLTPYTTYRNTGVSNIIKSDFLFSYHQGPMRLSLAANFFDKLQKVSDEEDYHYYWNASFGAIYAISREWTLYGELVYNSPVMTSTIESGPAFNGDLRISRVWNRWETYLTVTDILHRARYEITRNSFLTTHRYYDLYASSVILGASFMF